MRCAVIIFFDKYNRKRSLERPRRRWTDIRVAFKLIGFESVVLIHLAQNGFQRRAFLNTIMNFLVM